MVGVMRMLMCSGMFGEGTQHSPILGKGFGGSETRLVEIDYGRNHETHTTVLRRMTPIVNSIYTENQLKLLWRRLGFRYWEISKWAERVSERAEKGFFSRDYVCVCVWCKCMMIGVAVQQAYASIKLLSENKTLKNSMHFYTQPTLY